MKRIDELLKVVNDSTPADDPSYPEERVKNYAKHTTKAQKKLRVKKR